MLGLILPVYCAAYSLQPSDWRPISSTGVEFRLTEDTGYSGKAIRLEYDFKNQAGYVLAQRDFQQKMPANYCFEFWVKADSPDNDFEFKLMDPSGQNVWWVKKFAHRWPREWTRMVIRKSQIQFAWGPQRGPLQETGAVQFGVAANAGGKGTVWISDFKFLELPETKPFSPNFTASSSSGAAAGLAKGTGWKAERPGTATLRLDLGEAREVGGLIADGLPNPCDVILDSTTDGTSWSQIESQNGIVGGRAVLPTRELEAKSLRLRIRAGKRTPAVSKLKLLPWNFSSTPQAFLEGIAEQSPRGDFPLHLLRKQNFWTVSGGLNSKEEALISQYGQVELFRGGPSLEPFLRVGGKVRSWADVAPKSTLEQGSLPLPKVTWPGDVSLEAKTFAAEDGSDAQIIRYTLTNSSRKAASPELLIALRPMQVNPSWQALNLSPLVAPIERLVVGSKRGEFDGHTVLLVTPSSSQGATTTLRGDLKPFLVTGETPRAIASNDPAGLCTGLWKFDLSLKPGQSKTITLVYPRSSDSKAWTEERADSAWSQAVTVWLKKLGPVIADLPGKSALWPHVVRANLGYILVNKDGPATHPGSRTYQRSWIRDGSLSCAAMLQMGLFQEVREYIEWFTPHVREDGWVPCVVDKRGADPLAEHDSHGQYLYLLAEYFRFTRDIETIKKHFPVIRRVAEKIISLRHERSGTPYNDPSAPEHGFYGLLPQSASHEGYMDVHRHSYWDDFFGIKGLQDASYLAHQLGEARASNRYKDEAISFAESLRNSIAWTQTNRKINWIAGCVELGDFDGTSTAIGVYPCDAQRYLDPSTLDATFEKYAKWFAQRAANTIEWRDYTPYEVRVLSAMTFLGRKSDALSMLGWFQRDLRPAGWHHWAEVGYKDPEPGRWIGDMPHTWVGAEFIKAFRNMLVFESPLEINCLIIGAGIKEAWLHNGVTIRPLPTHYGHFGFKAATQGNLTTYTLSGSLRQGTKLIFSNPRSAHPHVVSVDGVNHQMEGNRLLVNGSAKRVEFIYE